MQEKTKIDIAIMILCVMVIAYGDIRVKKKMGVNVNVISPKRILVDDKTYFNILRQEI